MSVNGATVFDTTGRTENKMRREIIDLKDWQGKQATLEVYDMQKGWWGQIGVDDFRLTENPMAGKTAEKAPDFGTMCITLLGKGKTRVGSFYKGKEDGLSLVSCSKKTKAQLHCHHRLRHHLALPQHHPEGKCPDAETGHHYAKRFKDALDVARHIAKHKIPNGLDEVVP